MVIKASDILKFQSNLPWAHILLSLKFWQHNSGKFYYELVTIFIYYCKIDFVKENRKVIFTYNVFAFIHTWMWGISPEDTCWALHSMLPKTCRLLWNAVFIKFSDMQYVVMLNINMRSRAVIKMRLHIPEFFFRIWKVCF